MLLRFLMLGQIPGTNIVLSFWQIIAPLVIGVSILILNRFYPSLLHRIAVILRELVIQSRHHLQVIRSLQSIGRRG